MVRAGKPYSDASRASALSSASSFFAYLDVVSDELLKNLFDAVQRPVIDPDYSPAPATRRTKWVTLVVTARDRHRIAAYRKRAYALLLLLYTCCLRIDSLLSARVEHLGYDKGHHGLKVRVKGGSWKNKPVPPVAWDALRRERIGVPLAQAPLVVPRGRLPSPVLHRADPADPGPVPD
ncbi:hypothetical protein ACFPH6_25035 [Streptomyces xiangluensis]|uniref:Phage integrase family protein n=1 Tax=Streptomyces xiangluensis TaxID=2665720 RepID=A0ABV8YUD6_9ACTN